MRRGWKPLLVLGFVVAVLSVGALALGTFQASAETEWWVWYDDDEQEEPQEQNPKTVAPFTELALTLGKYQLGPCDGTQLEGDLYNNAMGPGEGKFLKSLDDGENCESTMSGCNVNAMTLVGFPWPIKLESATQVTVSEIEIHLDLSGGFICQLAGLGSTAVASGSVAGEFVPYEPEEEKPSTFVFNSSSGLELAPWGEVELDGIIDFGTKLTATSIP